jgi:aspartyl-tRNA(Asn)/glutamyl-tRNA(Gln) amidotransferase subunit C
LFNRDERGDEPLRSDEIRDDSAPRREPNAATSLGNGGPRRCLLHSAPVKITREEVRHVALLARLELTPEEEKAMAATLDEILTYMEQLGELDVSAVEPTAHVLDLATPLRDDRVTNTPATDALLANAPARDGDFFKVPKIIE